MKLVLKLLFVFISIATMLLIAALFVEKKIAIKEQLLVKKPAAVVFHSVKHLENLTSYLDWPSKPLIVRQTSNKPDGTEGYRCNVEFVTEAFDKGSFEIIEIIPNQLVTCAFVSRSGKPLNVELTITTTAQTDSTTLVGIELARSESYPRNLKLLFSKLESLESSKVQQSMRNLKDFLESEENTSPYPPN